jgi:hypothetical protein
VIGLGGMRKFENEGPDEAETSPEIYCFAFPLSLLLEYLFLVAQNEVATTTT